MPMIDVYATAGTFADTHQLAADLAAAVMAIEQVPDIPMFRQNTAAFIHDLPAGALSNVDGDTNYVRIQVLTNAGALDRGKQLAVVERLTSIAADAAGDPGLARPDLGAAHRGTRRGLGPAWPRQHQRGTRGCCPGTAGEPGGRQAVRGLTASPPGSAGGGPRAVPARAPSGTPHRRYRS